MITLKNIDIHFKKQTLFNHANLAIASGKVSAICGKSGSGKTTLFYILGLISSFKGYDYTFNGNEIDIDDDKLKASLRKSSIGFIFQDKNLHEYLSISQNIQLYSMIANKPCDSTKIKALLEKVNLTLDPSTKTEILSGGEKQRLAIACALAKDPEIIIADEPTSALDDKNTKHIIQLFKMIAKEGKMVVIATHNKMVQQACDVIYTIEDYQIKGTTTTIKQPTKPLQPSKISKTFYSWYSKFHFGEGKRKRLLITLIPTLSISLCIFMSALGNSLTNKYKESLNAFASNEIYAYNPTNVIPASSLKTMKTMKGVKDLHVIQKDNLFELLVDSKPISMDMISLVPYFNYQIKYFNTLWKQPGEIYLSYELANQLPIKKDTKITLKQKEYSIAGVFKQKYSLTQSTNDKYIIYVPASYFDAASSSEVLLEIESFEYIQDITNQIYALNSNYKLLLSQDKYISQVTQLEKYKKSLHTFILSLTSMMIVSLSISQLFSIHNQRYEISVLKANGLSKKEILQLMSTIFIRNVFTSIIFISLILIIEKIIASMWISVNIFSYSVLIQIIGFSLFIYMLPSFLALLYINHFDVEKLLRF